MDEEANNSGDKKWNAKTIFLIALFVTALAFGSYIAWSELSNRDKSNSNKAQFSDIKDNNKGAPEDHESSLDNDLRKRWSNGKCQGSGTIEFGTLPMKPEDFGTYLPYGMLAGAHVTPIDHSYFSPADMKSPRDKYAVYAIADGVIVNIGTRKKVVGDENHNQARAVEYRLDIEHTCTLYSYFDLVTSLAPDILAELDKQGGERFSGRIPIKEGQLIGRIGGQTLDFGVYNNDLTLDFINPQSYVHEPWKIHTDDPFKYFKEPAKSILISKNARKVEPIAGKIDYDIDGKLIGNWFKEGTRGYEGLSQDRYWDGHLAIVPDYLDPTQIRFSIGNFAGVAKQFGVKGNSPDPAIVDKNTGIVKYELVQYSYIDKATGEGWLGASSPASGLTAKNNDQIFGVALVQLMEDRKLKVEVFPDKQGSEITEFTDKAALYER